jgi:hypothetical protein
MSKIKIFCSICLLFLIIFPNVASSTVDFPYKNNENDTKINTTIAGPIIYVGGMWITGYGDYETAIVRPRAEKNLIITIPRGGSNLILKVYFRIDCQGWNDHGYVKFQVNGGYLKEADGGEFNEGYMYIDIPYCKKGDQFEWILYAKYCPILLNPWEFKDGFDIGGGIIFSPRTYNSFNNLFLINKILSEFIEHQFTFRGKIICN